MMKPIICSNVLSVANLKPRQTISFRLYDYGVPRLKRGLLTTCPPVEHSRRKMAHRYDRYRMLIGGQRVLTKHVHAKDIVGELPGERRVATKQVR